MTRPLPGRAEPTLSREEPDLHGLLDQFLAAGYRFSAFEKAPEARTVFLRHDIDFSLDHALRCARVEQEMGIAATYFFMLSSNFYNLHSQRSRAIVDEIAALGHHVRLHYDPTAHRDLDEGFDLERRTFERLFGVTLDVVSLHRPRDFLDNPDRQLAGVTHTYQSCYFREMAYLSDSGGSFKYGHPLASPAFQERRPIHLLLHPIWWVSVGATPSEKLRKWQAELHELLDEETALNCTTYERQGARGGLAQ